MPHPFLHRTLRAKIDRPLGSRHPQFDDLIYPVNYGYVPNTTAGDGEPVDAYILGVAEPFSEFEGECIAIIHRKNDNEDKLVLAPTGTKLSSEEIAAAVRFQERFFDSEVIQ